MTKQGVINEYLKNKGDAPLLNRYNITMVGPEGSTTQSVDAYSPGEALDLVYEVCEPLNYVQYAVQYVGVVRVNPIVNRKAKEVA